MTRGRVLLWSTIAAYCLIGMEIVIMISPFALYFYSIYGPILDLLSLSRYTCWTTEFFLPHMVFPDDALILYLSYLQVLLVVGLLLFFTAAIPLYYARFRGRGVVQISFYKKIRHPQYFFLAISGFGLLLYWPRFIILIMYVTMLFVYYLLARNEEWRMQQEAPQAYARYMASTPMFLPGEPGGRLFAVLFGWVRPKWAGILGLYLLTLSLAVFLAMGLRAYTVHTLQRVQAGEMMLVPVFPRQAATVRALYQHLLVDPAVRQQFAERPDINLGYLMPGDFFLMALVTDADRRFSDDMIQRFPEILEWHRYKFRGGLGKFFRIFYNFVSTWRTVPTNYDIERFVFVAVHDRTGQAVMPGRLFAMGLVRTPALIVDLDARTHEVLGVVPTSENNKWGRMPMPTF